ncbi:MAG: hypothetical protein QXL22_01100 [Candidatus Nezhaarchaeales archaeon]
MVKEALREIRKIIDSMSREIVEARREMQYTLHSLKITPIRNILMDEIRYRRPLIKLRRVLRGD